MKQGLLIILMALSGQNAYSQQVPKMQVAEHFTNTYCSVCASRNPGLYSNLVNFPAVLYLSYHPSSPYPACPLNQHNKLENDSRTRYYGVYGGTPQLAIQGAIVQGSYTNPALFPASQQQTSSFTANINLSEAGPDSLKAMMVVRKVDTSTLAVLNLYGALIEDTLFFTAQNGETIHRNVFRKAFWPSDTLRIAAPQNINDSVTYSVTIAKNSVWQLRRMFAVLLVQEDNRQMVQAARSQNLLPMPTGVTQFTHLQQLKVFPNPARNLVQIETAEEMPLLIRDAMGRVFYRNEQPAKLSTIDVSEWANGLYFIRSGSLNATFIKQ